MHFFPKEETDTIACPIYGLIACAIAYVPIQRTTFGFAACTAGGNILAARIAGLPIGKLCSSCVTFNF
jgi:ABC-type uncharacterized transport system permease subunit